MHTEKGVLRNLIPSKCHVAISDRRSVIISHESQWHAMPFCYYVSRAMNIIHIVYAENIHTLNVENGPVSCSSSLTLLNTVQSRLNDSGTP